MRTQKRRTGICGRAVHTCVVRAVLAMCCVLGVSAGAMGQTGACCKYDGTCYLATFQACETDPSGAHYLGAGTTCAGTPCVGACCLPDGTCILADRFQSLPLPPCNNGRFFGPGTTCTAKQCLGACCLPDGTCVLTGLNTGYNGRCGPNSDGRYRGDGTTCDAPCSGACCFSDGSCINVTSRNDCYDQAGSYHGDGSVCGSTSCPTFINSGLSYVPTVDIPISPRTSFFDLTASGSSGVLVYRIDVAGSQFGSIQSDFVSVYTRSGSYINHDTEPTAWTLQGVFKVVSGPLNPGYVDLPTPIYIPQGSTMGFAVAAKRSIAVAGVPYSISDSNVTLFSDTARGALFSGANANLGFGSSVYYILTDGASTGACCLPNGTCQALTGPACASQGGKYSGDSVTCGAVSCAPPGACCLPNGSCVSAQERTCVQQEGVWNGAGSVCGSVSCAQPGACCFPSTMTCQILSQSQCRELSTVENGVFKNTAYAGGVYQGDGTTCSAVCPQPPAGSVAILGATTSEYGNTDIREKLVASGLFPFVAILPNDRGAVLDSNLQPGNPIPPLGVLQQFSAVLVYGEGVFIGVWDSWALGSELADYVDSGGGVVLAGAFSNAWPEDATDIIGDAGFFTASTLRGRWDSSYQIIPRVHSGLAAFDGPYGLGTVLNPGHPIMQGVSTFTDGGTCIRPPSTGLTSHGVKVALWNDPAASTLVAVSNTLPNRADLGFVPISNTLTAYFSDQWDHTTDGGKIIANALKYVLPAAATTGICCRGSTCSITTEVDCTTTGGVGKVFVAGSSCNASGNATTPCCYADFDKTGGINVSDIFAFLRAWFGHNPAAVVGGDGSTGTPTVSDIFAFLRAWFAHGC